MGDLVKRMKRPSLASIGWIIVSIILLTGIVFGAAQMMTMRNTATIRASWVQFDINRSEKRRAVNALRRELGFGGMIHLYKDLVLRGDQEKVHLVEHRLGGAFAQISWYRNLAVSMQELAALDAIEETLHAYEERLRLIGRLALYGRTPEQIDRVVRVDDGPALAALDLLDRTISGEQRADADVSTKPLLINLLRKHLGYGGLIHDFKNLILRREEMYVERVEADLNQVEQILDLYRAQDLSEKERVALRDISGGVQAYKIMVPTVARLARAGASPREIDETVQLDEVPLVTGFTTLTREVIALDAANARRMGAALDHVDRVATFALSVAAGLILSLVVLSIWLIRHLIVGPITDMTLIMTRLAAGELEIPVPNAERGDEIGAMARAIEVFRHTAIKRNQAEQALREQEKSYRLILDNAADGVVTVDSGGRIELFNPAAERIFGYSAQEALGENINNLITNPPSRGLGDFVGDFVESGEPVGRREYVGHRRDGASVPLEVAISTLDLGERTVFTGLVSDISERKQAESLKNEFISTVSHELRTPLTSIKGALVMVESGRLADQAKIDNMISVAAKNTERLITLVNDLLDFEKLQAGKMDFTPGEIRIGDLARRVMEANQPFAQQHGVRMQLLDLASDAVILGDSDRLTQVLVNLISNAVKFSPRDGLVNISVERVPERVRVSVTDHGPGIPEDFRDRIFDRFSQADSSDTRRRGGTGLGLSISRVIVERHGGSLNFESEEGSGSIFYFDLPEMRFEFTADEIVTNRPEPAASQAAYRILVVEDDPDIANLITLILEQQGFVVDTVHDGPAARACMAERDYDAMTLDVMLPGDDGISLLKEMRDAPHSWIPPVIVVSVKAGAARDALAAVGMEAVAYLEKPIDRQRLLDSVGIAIMGASRLEKRRILFVEDDPDLREVLVEVIGTSMAVDCAETVGQARPLLANRHYDLVVIDPGLPDGSGLDLLPLARNSRGKPMPVIIYSSTNTDPGVARLVDRAMVKSRHGMAELMSAITEILQSDGGDAS